MNIEEEREAFEAAVLPNGLVTSVAWDGSRYTFPDGGKTLTQDYFEVWLKAKEHTIRSKYLLPSGGCLDNKHCFIMGRCFHCGLNQHE